ncbi:hypothetical protein GCM10023168_32080 [Fodinibacter luteus]|uniref:Uncharacterized protein n=1 Tax=Fodinibacter luteus TaxID=552064 RepID=A0ABP8KN09_9MICO
MRETREFSWSGKDPKPRVIAAALDGPSESLDDVDLRTLAQELGRLRSYLESKAVSDPEMARAGEAIGQAEETALRGDGPRTVGRLKRAGTAGVKAARDIGVEVAAAAISRSMGLP